MKTFLKRILLKPFIFITILVVITLSCEETNVKPNQSESEKKIVKTSLTQEKHLESALDATGFIRQTSNGISNGRANEDGVEIDTENIIKVLQDNNSNYTYTFNIQDDHHDNAFSNLILEENGDGYIGFILQYESTGEFNGLLNFTGILKRWDLAGRLLSEISFADGHIVEATSASGRTKVANCLAANISVSCVSWGYLYNYNNTQTTGFGCLDYETIVDIYEVECSSSSSGSAGSTGITGGSVGTYIPSGGGGGTGSGGTSSGGSTSGSIGVSADEMCGEGMYFDDGLGRCISTTYYKRIIVGGVDPNAVPIENINEHLKCFNSNNPAKVTIYVTQPVNNSAACEFNLNVGHAFIGISQNQNIRTIGFYPKGKAHPGSPEQPMQFRDNQNKPWDVSVAMDISSDELNNLLNYIKNGTPDIYNLNSFNCSTWVASAFSAMGINLPKNIGWWPNGGGMCPGLFGQNLRNLSIPNRALIISPSWETGKAPANAGTCP